MVDIRELQKKGLISNNARVELPPTNRHGFIYFSKKEKTKKIAETTPSSTTDTSQSSGSVFGFMDSFSSSPSPSFSSETDGYSKREVDRRLEQLDNKIYKLEQRIELLERKANISSY